MKKDDLDRDCFECQIEHHHECPKCHHKCEIGCHKCPKCHCNFDPDFDCPKCHHKCHKECHKCNHCNFESSE